MPETTHDSTEQPLFARCATCGEPLETEFSFCPHCGTAIPSRLAGSPAEGVRQPRLQRRRRIGGTVWTRPVDPSDDDDTEIFTTDHGMSPGAKRRRRRHKKRRFYRRPLIVIPLMLLVVLSASIGAVAYRAESTMATLQQVSTPPPVVADNTIGEDPIPNDVTIDSAPARQAVQSAAAAGTLSLPSSDSGGILGGIKSAASSAGDLAQGAAVASGVKEPSTDALTILIMGVDARPGAPIDVSVRPDALMVLRLDPTTGSCRGLAIPRDTLVELPGYGQTKINHALMVGGIPYQLLVVEQLLGIDIDRYALIDFTGFQELVDAVGGVPVTVPQAITKDGETLFSAGPQTFSGAQALSYARYRGGADVDVGRVRRQQQIIRGLIGVAQGRDTVRDVNRLLPALEGHFRTDLSPAEIVALAEHYRTTCAENELQLDVLQGNFQQATTPDPIFKRPMAYNVVPPETITEKVAALTRP